MNAYPSWIHRIPELLEILALVETERIDRQVIEQLFDLRNTAAKNLLRRMGAHLAGNSFVIGRGLLMARLREAAEHPDWSFEVDRRRRTARKIAELRSEQAGRAKVLITEQQRQALEWQSVANLPSSITLSSGLLSIAASSMEELMQQLMMLIKVIDNEYDTIRELVEGAGAEADRWRNDSAQLSD